MPPLPRRRRDGENDLALTVDALRRIVRELRLIARKTELAAGLSAAQVFVLQALTTRPRMSINEAAAATMTDRSSAAAVIERLTEAGYAARVQAAEDRRRAEVSITARGRLALRRAAPPPTTVLIGAIRAMSSAERSELARGLTALVHRMGIEHGPAGMLFEDLPRPKRRRTHG